MKQCKNLEAAKQLVINYRIITLEDIRRIIADLFLGDFFGPQICLELTGFGSTAKCILCRACVNCNECIYCLEINSIAPCVYHPTYLAINGAINKLELLEAINNRADYIEALIKEKENDN